VEGTQEVVENPWGDTEVNFKSWNTGFEYDIVPGDVVTLEDTDTGVTKTHTALDIAITGVDDTANIVEGYADEGSELVVWAHWPCDKDVWVTADGEGGTWTATFDCVLSTVEYIHLEQYGDDDTTYTSYFWTPPPPDVSHLGQIYFNDFDGAPVVAPGVTDTLGGVTNLEPIQGYVELDVVSSAFGGNFLRNATGDYASGDMGIPGLPTTLTLTGLPPHTSIDINFLLAIIDSWDGSGPGGCCHPDILTVTVDGNIVFSESFGFMNPSFVPPRYVLLEEYTPLGFNPDFDDAAYDMGLNPAFDDIPHSGNTLTIEWYASGAGWQGGDDESWAIDNLEIILEKGIDIDIKPDGDPNSINLDSMGVVPVAVLTTDDFDASSIDPVSVTFAGAYPLRWAMEDVDLDGDMDYLFIFKTQELNLDENSTEAMLTGLTFEGVFVTGVDAVVPVGVTP
jgi:hypothetical protein